MAKNPSGGGAGPTQRQLKVGESIRRALADVLLRGSLHDDSLVRASITVAEVRMSSDLRNATAFVLPLGGINTDEVIEALRRNKGEIRRLLSKDVKLKHSPDLSFQRDDSYDRMDEARRLLNTARVRADVEAVDDRVEDDDARES